MKKGDKVICLVDYYSCVTINKEYIIEYTVGDTTDQYSDSWITLINNFGYYEDYYSKNFGSIQHIRNKVIEGILE